jgi:hypothetical protein
MFAPKPGARPGYAFLEALKRVLEPSLPGFNKDMIKAKTEAKLRKIAQVFYDEFGTSKSVWWTVYELPPARAHR